MKDDLLLQQVTQKAEAWLSSDYDEATRTEVQELMKDPKNLIESFYQNLSFGTGGLRGIMGAGTNRMNRYTVGMATQGLANYLLKTFAELEELKVAIAYDCRNNSSYFAEVTANIFAANGFTVYLFDTLRPTPELSFAVRELNCQGGVVITASHNPKEYNGYKAYWNDGAQVNAPHDENIIAEVNRIADPKQVKFEGGSGKIIVLDEAFDQKYLETLKTLLCLSPESIQRQKDLKIVYTPLHGTGVKLVPDMLRSMGFENIVPIEAQNINDGNFPTVISPNPEEPSALKMALEKAVETEADIVMATDPDADRFGIAVKNQKGEFEILNGNQSNSILIYYLLKKWKELGKLTGNEYIIKTIVTTNLMAKIAEAYDVQWYNVYTGFKYIAEVIREKEDQTYIGGGEESFGFNVGSFVRDKDAVMTCALVAEVAAWAKDQGKTLFDVLLDIYVEFGCHQERQIAITMKGKDGLDQIRQLMVEYRANPPQVLGNSPVVERYDYANLTCTTASEVRPIALKSTSNVLQFVTEDGSWVSVRPSGTEPKIKFYFGVCSNMENVSEYAGVTAALSAKIEQLADDIVPGRKPLPLPEATEPITESKLEEPTHETVDFSEEEEALHREEAELDFTTMNRSELIDAFRKILQSEDGIQKHRKEVEDIKINFYKLLKTETEQIKQAYVTAGHDAESFEAPSDVLEQEFKVLMNRYREVRIAMAANIEKQKEDNYVRKMALIDQIKTLTEAAVYNQKTFHEFHEILKKWKEIDGVPQAKMQDLWDNYYHQVELFYNHAKIDKELRDLDFKKNYEEKLSLCCQAEDLLLNPSPIEAFNQLQTMHARWKEIGPVSKEFKEVLWDRFKEATSKINKQHQEYFDEQKVHQLKNLEAKIALCEQAESIAKREYIGGKEFNQATLELIEIQKVWKTIGFAPKKDNAKLFKRFRTACDEFFAIRKNFFKHVKSELTDNMQMKLNLCEKAEALMNSDDWKATTDLFIAMQKEWKTIGAVSRKQSDIVWKRFRTACDTFFNNKEAYFAQKDEALELNLEKKRGLLEEINAFEPSADKDTMAAIKAFQARWMEIGHVPMKEKDKIYKAYKTALDRLFQAFRSHQGDKKPFRSHDKYNASEQRNDRKGSHSERDRLIAQVKKLEADISVWENNIGFFAKSKNAEILVQEVRKKIEHARAEMLEIMQHVRNMDANA